MANKIGIGYSPLTQSVYLGKQNKDKGMWIGDKQEITSDFLDVAHQYFEVNTMRTISHGPNQNLFINIPKDKAGIIRAIKALNIVLEII